MSKVFEGLERRARSLDEEAMGADLVSLATDPRFAAVIAWLLEREARFVAGVVSPITSREHGPLAHAAGGAYATKALLDDLKERLEVKPRRKERPQETED